MVSSISFPHLCNDDKSWPTYFDEASDVTPFTFNNKIVMSNIDFNESPTQASSLTSNIVEEKQSSQELNGAPSSEPRRYPVNNPSTNIDIDTSVNPNNCPESIQLQCTYLVYFPGQHTHSSFIPSDRTRACSYTRSLKGRFSITMDYDLN